MTRDTVLVEALDGHGRMLWRDRVQLDDDRKTFTIGRSLDADVVVDDPYVAGLHASIGLADRGLVVTDLGTVNGIVAGGVRRRGPEPHAFDGNELQIGRTRLRIRSQREPVLQEMADQIISVGWLRNPLWLTVIGGSAIAAQLIYTSWLPAPTDLTASVVSNLAMAAGVFAVWVTIWALLSRIMQGEWRWLRHAAIVLCCVAVSNAIAGALDFGWFALALPFWPHRAIVVGALALAAILYLHLRNASTLRPRYAALAACLLPALVSTFAVWQLERQRAQSVDNISAALRVYPPDWRMRNAESLNAYFTRVDALRSEADRRAAAMATIEPLDSAE